MRRRSRVRVSRWAFVLSGMLIAACWSSTALAEHFDWRDVDGQNWVTPVKSQFGGTCWDFAACGVLESKYMLTRNDSSYRPDVSEQHAVHGVLARHVLEDLRECPLLVRCEDERKLFCQTGHVLAVGEVRDPRCLVDVVMTAERHHALQHEGFLRGESAARFVSFVHRGREVNAPER